MPFSFPSSPSIGDKSTQNGREYEWSGYAWEIVATPASLDASVITSGTFDIARIPTHTHTISQVSGLQTELDGKASVSATNVSRVVSLNGLTGTLTIAAGDNVTVSTAGSTITVAASAAGASGEQPYGQILIFG
jgi:microcystin-dependent protein